MATHATISQAKGSTGPEVTDWQTRLNAKGFTVAVSGVFDAATTTATKSWQAANSLTADGIVGPASWAKMTGEKPPPQYVPAYGSKAQFGRETLLAAWPVMIAEAKQSKYPEVRALAEAEEDGPSLSTIQTFQAMAQLESAYGLASYKGPNGSKVLNNWGAVQSGKPVNGQCPPGSWLVGDTGAQGAYTHCYKEYATPAEGALHFLRHLTINRPHSWAAAQTGDLDEYSVRMHSWTPPLTSLGQGSAGKKLNLDPITDTPGYFEQPPLTGSGRAKGLYDRAFAIAQVLGEPLEVARGGPYVPGSDDGDGGGGDGDGDGDEPPRTEDWLPWVVGVALAAVGGGLYAWRTGMLRRFGVRP